MSDKDAIKKVKAKWLVNIPSGSKVVVKEGDMVEPGQTLVELSGEEEKTYDFSVETKSLSSGEKEKLKTEVVGTIVAKGEILYQGKGMWSKKVLSTFNGKITRVDEYLNIYVVPSEQKIRKITAPVKAKISHEGESLALEFRAEEYPGTGISEGKVWGQKGLKKVTKMGDLNMADGGKIILVEELNIAILLKAEVMGISGVVLKIEDKTKINDKINANLPVLAMENDTFEKLEKMADDETRSALLNATSGRLLLVIGN